MEVGRRKATYPQCLSLHGVGGFGEVVRLSDLMRLDRPYTAHSRPLVGLERSREGHTYRGR